MAVNEDQIEEYGLLTKPRNGNDERSASVVETVEAEALPAPVLRGIVRAWVGSYLTRADSNTKRMDEEGQQFLRAFGKA